jgi:hypothetical protein
MRIMTICRVVGVDHARRTKPENFGEIPGPRRTAGRLQVCARKPKLHHRGIPADPCGFALLFPPQPTQVLHPDRAGPHAPGAIRHDHAGKTARNPLALGDAVESHELKIVSVCADRQMGHAREGFGQGHPGRDKNVTAGPRKK